MHGNSEEEAEDSEAEADFEEEAAVYDRVQAEQLHVPGDSENELDFTKEEVQIDGGGPSGNAEEAGLDAENAMQIDGGETSQV